VAGEQMRLSSFLKTLGDELRVANASATSRTDGPILEIAECELELGLRWEVEGSAGANFYVFRLGGGAKQTQTQTIRLRLTPTDPMSPPAGGQLLETPGFPAATPRPRGIPVVETDGEDEPRL
jgi:hypothetical protein